MKRFRPHLKTLIVDDHRAPRRVLKEILLQLGLNDIEEAETANGAIQRFEHERYDLIICDLYLGKQSGLDVLTYFRETDGGENKPFIIITSDFMMDDIQKASESGVSGYMIKPFSVNQVEECLEESFKKHKLNPFRQ